MRRQRAGFSWRDGGPGGVLVLTAIALLIAETAAALAQSAQSAAASGRWMMVWPIVLTAANLPLLVSVWRQRAQAAMDAAAPCNPHETNVVDRVRLIRHDPLTSLANRRTFDDLVAGALAGGRHCAVLALDVDDFRTLNDTLGFEAGDAVLQQIGDRLRLAVPDQHSVAHLFSDDFAILHTGSVEDADALALHILRIFDQAFFCDSGSPHLSGCIGIAVAPQHGHDATSLLQAANQALKLAQGEGHGHWRVCDSGSQATQEALRAALPAAVANGEIVPFYQPIIDISTGRVAGMEVLARWQHPGRGLLPSAMFIDLAEREGVLSEITRHLLSRAAHDSVDWAPELFFAFNVAPSQLNDLRAIVLAQAEQAGLPLNCLEFELTEATPVSDMAATAELVDDLRARGVRVALDDFGAGYGNFHHLRGIAFDTLKIDQEFVLEVLTDPRADFCVRAIASVGQMLGIDVTAEGVSTPEVAARVAALGCRFMQGSLFSMPVPADEVPELLARLAPAPQRLARGSVLWNAALART